ncbi:MAG TPA: helix-turn-helix domain-containing protein [Mesorhizobium sp.]|nr:helix-turn-helix domain-containing protein [Mesorhizobium sp.]
MAALVKTRRKRKQDESVPAHPELGPEHPLVVFGDHGFCAGATLEVKRMDGPHMHSQVELNLVLEGSMRYRFDLDEVTVRAGQLVLFWGMVPHQVVAHAENTRFVCLYAPISVVLGLKELGAMREALFAGALVEAAFVRPRDPEIFLGWREELLGGGEALAGIVRDELSARIRRLARDGWRDLRIVQVEAATRRAGPRTRLPAVEAMTRFIAEHALDDISVEDVARVAGLHPHYATALFKRGVGMGIAQAILRHRLDTASSLLASTDLAIGTVAFESGFGSLSRFYEAFGRRFGCKPAAFRKKFGTAGT